MLQNKATPIEPREETGWLASPLDHQLLGSHRWAAIKDIFQKRIGTKWVVHRKLEQCSGSTAYKAIGDKGPDLSVEKPAL